MMHPLFLVPIYRRYLWGGRRFATALGRSLPPGDDFAESWELVDRGADDQSVVACGPLAGRTLGDLVRGHGRDLLGRHAPLPAFPLLLKFLDANRDLSVQVHPDDARAGRLVPPDRGKTEAWYVVAAEPGSRIYAGLVPGTDRESLAAAIRSGACASVLHSFPVQPGDCVYVPAGTVHAIGAGLLVAEIQQSSDVTYRLFDWNRIGSDGRPRPLHVEAGVEAVTRFAPVAPATPTATADPAVQRLATSDYFVFDEVRPGGSWAVGGDEACHVLVVLEGTLHCDGRWNLPAASPGQTLLIPAALGRERFTFAGGTAATLLHVTLP